jgi:hypothetical protein
MLALLAGYVALMLHDLMDPVYSFWSAPPKRRRRYTYYYGSERSESGSEQEVSA